MEDDGSILCKVYKGTRIKQQTSNNAFILFLVTRKNQKLLVNCKGTTFAMTPYSGTKTDRWVIGVVINIDYINKSIVFKQLQRCDCLLNVVIYPRYQIYELNKIISFRWVNKITGYSQGSKINTTSYINTYDQCYDMSTNGPDVLKIHDNWSFYSSYETNYLLEFKEMIIYLKTWLDLLLETVLNYTKNEC